MLRRFDLRAVLIVCTCMLLLWTGRLSAAPWLPFGPDGGDARRFAADPHDNAHLFLGTANGWIYESHNSGTNWKRLAQVGKRDDLVLDSIVVDPTDSRHLIVGAFVVGSQPDGGIFLSHDGGLTWISQAEMRGQSIRAITMAPSNPKILVAGALRGVYRSTDGGQHWKLISPEDSTEIHEIQSVAIDPVDPNIIYAGTWHLPWKTTDAGEHWDSIKTGIIVDSDVFSIIIDPVAPKIVYASACSGIYKSEDAGQQFRKVEGIPTAARRTRVLLQDPSHLATVFAGTTEGLFRSDDAGIKWSRTTSAEIIVNDVFVDKNDPRHVLIATDRGGVLASEDGGDTFQPSNGGFSARQIIAFKKDSTNPATLYVGVVNDKEWGGVFESDNGGIAWTQRSNGLQGRDVFSLGQAPDGTMIAGTAHGLFRLDKEAATWNRVEDAPAGASEQSAHSLPQATRPPVPVERNRFTQRTGLSQASVHRPARTLPSRASVRSSTPTTRAHATQSASVRATATHKPHTLAANKKSTPRDLPARTAPAKSTHPVVAASSAVVAEKTSTLLAKGKFFDGSVFSLATSDKTVLALTSIGLLSSDDQGATWRLNGQPDSADWRFMAAAGSQAVAASLKTVESSSDSGATWSQVNLPQGLTSIEAVAVEPSGEIWVGGREGIFVSADHGATWSTPKNLFLNAVNSIYYDETANRILVTANGESDLAFTVQLPDKSVTFTNTGWNLRFVRPVGDHLVAVTLFDGIVIQPKMVASPASAKQTASR